MFKKVESNARVYLDWGVIVIRTIYSLAQDMPGTPLKRGALIIHRKNGRFTYNGAQFDHVIDVCGDHSYWVAEANVS